MSDQVNDTDQGQGTDNQDTPSLGWRSALPDEFKEHEAVKDYTKPGDFVKDAIADKAAHAELKTKMETAIFKPGENATPEDIIAFRTTMGVPEKPEEYDLSNGDVEHSPEMVNWFGPIAHKIGLTQEQVTGLVPDFDAFVMGLVEADAVAKEKAVADAEQALKVAWGTRYDEELEFTRRGFEHFFGKDSEFKGFLEKDGMGNHPLLHKAFNKMGRALGDDWSPASATTFNKEETKLGIVYDKSPDPPNKE